MFHVKHSFPLRAPRPPRSCCQVFRLLRRARVPCALLRAHALVPPSARRRSASLLPSPGASRPSARVLALVFVRARHLSLAPHSSARNACLPRILAPPPRSFPPRIFAEIPFLLRLSRLRPFARPRPLLRSASAHSLVAPTSYSASLLLSAPVPLPPSVLPTPPLPAKNCYGTILIVP